MSQTGNRLTRIFTDEELTDVKTAVKSVTNKLSPFLTNVTEEEVPSLLKVGDGDKVLTSDCLSESREAEHLLPPVFKMTNVQVSDTLHDQLYEIEDGLFELYLTVRRNRMLAGSEALGGVSTFYAYIKTAATGKDKLPDAVAMFKSLQGYYLKRLEASKAQKRKAEAEKLAVEKAHAEERAALAS